MAPYEALYEHKCRSVLCLDEIGERQLLGTDVVQRTYNKIEVIRKRLKIVQSRQKSYVDTQHRDLEFKVGNKVFLKVTPIKRIKRFGKKGKLSLRFVGPFEILKMIGSVAYQLALLPEWDGTHDVLIHVSMLRKYISDPSHVIDYSPLQLEEGLTYVQQPIQILDREEQQLRSENP